MPQGKRPFEYPAFSAAFVPLFAGIIAHDGKARAKSFAEDAMAVLLTALFIFVVAGEFATPWLLDILAPGFRADHVLSMRVAAIGAMVLIRMPQGSPSSFKVFMSPTTPIFPEP